MDRTLNLLIQSSDYYAPFAGCMLTSLFENNIDLENINVYLLTTDMAEKNRGRFEILAEWYGRKIEFLDSSPIDVFLKENHVPEWRGSYATYHKIFALSLIKDNMKRLVYMDADIVVNGSLLKLINADLKQNVLGMCIDVVPEAYKKMIGHDSSYYYNAGMVVFDVEKWIKEDYMNKIIDHIKLHPAYPLVDQDLLNLVLCGKIQTLSQVYNLNTGILPYKNHSLIKYIYGVEHWYSQAEWMNAQANAIVLHCFGTLAMHPWFADNDHPVKELWNKYLKKSPWSDFVPIKQEMPFSLKFRRMLFKYLPHKLYAFAYRNALRLKQKINCKKLGI